MCGIFGYIGKKKALPLILKGLADLEYRGYDSVGIYIPNAGIVKSVGAVQELKKKLTNRMVGTSGIAHLRWATHGEPTEVNAHPHVDCSNTIHVVHNGIIENYVELKKDLRFFEEALEPNLEWKKYDSSYLWLDLYLKNLFSEAVRGDV